MDSKKKKKTIIISICIAVIVVAAVITGTVLGIKYSDSGGISNNASNMSTNTQTNTYNEAIASKLVPVDYNGIYVFKMVKGVELSSELTEKDFNTLCTNMGLNSADKNSLNNKLQQDRAAIRDDNHEKIIFFNGQFNRNFNNNPKDAGSDKGQYYGDNNLTLVEAGKGVFFISLNYADLNNNIPVANTHNQEKKQIYVMEKVYSKTNPKRLLFTVTYIYELLQEEVQSIPDSELYF